ncbi:MAG: FAD:protein FMN transferase [Pirellulales bacterium]|nr:FAD:protein FMN transferase [Pirellulales bacterium]
MPREQLVGGGLIVALIVLVGVGLWKTSAPHTVAVVRQSKAVMGTSCTLMAIVPSNESVHADQIVHEAETTLRGVEARMSAWLNDSELGRFNAAGASREIPLSPETLAVLRTARQAWTQTGGAFDVTCRPLIELWRDAGRRDMVPTDSALDRARAASSWDDIELTATGAAKRTATASVDLGGIAKGYAIDQAADVLWHACVDGGLVDVGGDLVCFGRPHHGHDWPIDVKNPFGPGILARLRIGGGAVCTSGNYARFTQIGGRRYSHIIDPRTGRPADVALSVTVWALDAVTADVWATALSVLREQGLARLPQSVEALLVVGTKDQHHLICTPGFRLILDEPLPAGLRVWKPPSIAPGPSQD